MYHNFGNHLIFCILFFTKFQISTSCRHRHSPTLLSTVHSVKWPATVSQLPSWSVTVTLSLTVSLSVVCDSVSAIPDGETQSAQTGRRVELEIHLIYAGIALIGKRSESPGPRLTLVQSHSLTVALVLVGRLKP